MHGRWAYASRTATAAARVRGTACLPRSRSRALCRPPGRWAGGLGGCFLPLCGGGGGLAGLGLGVGLGLGHLPVTLTLMCWPIMQCGGSITAGMGRHGMGEEWGGGLQGVSTRPTHTYACGYAQPRFLPLTFKAWCDPMPSRSPQRASSGRGAYTLTADPQSQRVAPPGDRRVMKRGVRSACPLGLGRTQGRVMMA